MLWFFLQSVALLAVVMICICRINAMRPGTKHGLKSAYLLLATGAFSALAEGETSWHTALLSAGMALSFITDRRKSECYSPVRDPA